MSSTITYTCDRCKEVMRPEYRKLLTIAPDRPLYEGKDITRDLCLGCADEIVREIRLATERR